MSDLPPELIAELPPDMQGIRIYPNPEGTPEDLDIAILPTLPDDVRALYRHRKHECRIMVLSGELSEDEKQAAIRDLLAYKEGVVLR